MSKIDAILKRLREAPGLAGVDRWDYTGGMTALELVEEAEAVGKFRTEGFVIDGGVVFAYDNIARWMLGDRKMLCINPDKRTKELGDLRKGLYLAGRTGCGKSWAMEIFSFLAREHRLLVTIGGKDILLAPKAYRADEITGAFMRDGDICPFVEAPVLLIDDLGTEQPEVVYMGNRVDVLRQVLEMRADRARLTLVTSNIPMRAEALKERYGDRVVSRLHQMCNYIEMTGDDWRVR